MHPPFLLHFIPSLSSLPHLQLLFPHAPCFYFSFSSFHHSPPPCSSLLENLTPIFPSLHFPLLLPPPLSSQPLIHFIHLSVSLFSTLLICPLVLLRDNSSQGAVKDRVDGGGSVTFTECIGRFRFSEWLVLPRCWSCYGIMVLSVCADMIVYSF